MTEKEFEERFQKIVNRDKNNRHSDDVIYPPLDIELADEFISKSLGLIKKHIQDIDEYRLDIYSIFPRIDDYDELFYLIDQEIEEYNEERTLRISKILHEACYEQLTKEAIERGVRVEYSLSFYRRKPAMYFAARAADNKSVKGSSLFADYLTGGYGDIRIDEAAAYRLWAYAATRGDLNAFEKMRLTAEDYRKMIKNENVMAYAGLFLYYYKKNNRIGAAIALKNFREKSTPQQRLDVIDYLDNSYLSFTYGLNTKSVTDYLLFKRNTFRFSHTILTRIKHEIDLHNFFNRKRDYY